MASASISEKVLFEAHSHRLSWSFSSYDPIINAIERPVILIPRRDARVVLIGDGSHGTYEFYAHRANLTKRLIEEKGFTALAIEADWPDALRINRYIHDGTLGEHKIKNARDALAEIERFPKWMWKNEVMPPFIEYLKQHNKRVLKTAKDPSNAVSLYGMDLYSLHRSAQQVIEYLERVDPEGAKAARKRYNCFERFGEDTMRYAYETQFGLKRDCHREVIANLKSLLRNHNEILEKEMRRFENGHPREEQLIAEINALVVKDAEEYYRTMMTEDVLSWNLRWYSMSTRSDEHFARVLASLAQFLGPSNCTGPRRAKIVVWAHNSHVGDARATDMGRRQGEINVGQRCREIFGDDQVFSIGFLISRGTVTASYNWDEPPYRQSLNPPMEGSVEAIIDKWTDTDTFVVTHKIVTDDGGKTRKVEASEDLSEYAFYPISVRFVGVIYRRLTEKPSHYARCSVAKQFDCIAHVRESRGIEPLEREPTWKGPRAEVDVTFPFAL
ncbi:hypothetical protein C8Q79DRAFT_897295 [Trametes meyenii]|nr:hypothetical protein C8Q79DRAFT_897295 [Trametes meyenii]